MAYETMAEKYREATRELMAAKLWRDLIGKRGAGDAPSGYVRPLTVGHPLIVRHEVGIGNPDHEASQAFRLVLQDVIREQMPQLADVVIARLHRRAADLAKLALEEQEAILRDVESLNSSLEDV